MRLPSIFVMAFAIIGFGAFVLTALPVFPAQSGFERYLSSLDRDQYREGLPPMEKVFDEAPLPDGCAESATCRASALMVVANYHQDNRLDQEAFNRVESPFDVEVLFGIGSLAQISVGGDLIASGALLQYNPRELHAMLPWEGERRADRDSGYILTQDLNWEVNGPVKERFADEVERVYASVRDGSIENTRRNNVYKKLGIGANSSNPTTTDG